MIRLLTAALFFASFNALAQTQVPNVFEDGTPATAADVNENFDALEAAIDAIPEGPAGPQGEPGPAGGADGFGNNTNWATDGNSNSNCQFAYLGQVFLSAGDVAIGTRAEGQLLPIYNHQSLFSLLGTYYGGDGRTTFALPDLRDTAPDGMTYSICLQGYYPSRN